MNEKYTILAVDDTAESLALLVEILTPAGYQVRPADSGDLALAAVAANLPDLILLDVRMEGLDGLEVCRRLKAREETRHIPIILVSAFADVKEWVEGLQRGAADFITKPFQPEELLTRVKTHLSLKQANISVKQQQARLRQTNEQLQSEILERKQAEGESKKKNEELERFKHLAVGREMRMLELKQKVNELSSQLGLAPPYNLAFLDEMKSISEIKEDDPEDLNKNGSGGNII